MKILTSNCWILEFECVCFINNIMEVKSLNWIKPHDNLTGYTPYISMIYIFVYPLYVSFLMLLLYYCYR